MSEQETKISPTDPLYSGDGYDHIARLRGKLIRACQRLATNVGSTETISCHYIEVYSREVREAAIQLNAAFCMGEEEE